MIIGTNFKLSSAKFLDDRQLCKDYATLIANTEGIIYPPGFEVFCEYENKYYQYVSDTNGGYIWEERKSGVSDGTIGASIKDDTISEEYTWSSAHIDSMRMDLENLITQANDYVDEIDERMLFIEGKFQWFEYFDGSYESLTDKPTIPTKISELEDDIEINTKIEGKVDKEEGKVLIDFQELNRLSTIENYDDTELRNRLLMLDNNSHSHDNGYVLDSITEEMIEQWNNNIGGVEDYNYLANKPIMRIGEDIDLIINVNDIKEKGIYIINGIICGMQFINELCLTYSNDLESNINILMLNSMKKIVISGNEEEWEIIEEENYGVDKNNAKISDTLTIGEDKIILDKEGNGWYGGKVSQEGIPTEDKDLVTKGYVDERFTNYATNERINAIEKENARRDVIIEALANGRKRTIETDGNDVDLIFSTEKDNVWIDKIEGDTMVNVCDQEEPIAITKSYTVEGTNHVSLQGGYDGKCRPVVQGNTLVNHNVEYDKSIIIGERIDNRQGTEILNLEGTPNCEIKVDIDGHTAINLSTKKEDILCKSFDNASGNEINLVAEENSVSDLVIQGNTMVNLVDISKTSKGTSGGATISRDFLNKTVSLVCTKTGSLVVYYNSIYNLKPNTTYTVITEVQSDMNLHPTQNYYIGIIFAGINSDGNFEYGISGAPVVGFTNDFSNFVKITAKLTTPAEGVINGVSIGNHGSEVAIEGTVLNVRNTMLFEGDLTQTPELIPTEYVEGLQSTFEDKLIPYSIYNGDNLTSITETQYQLPLTIEPNTQYTVTTTANTTKYQYAVYSTDGLTEYLSYDTTVATQTFTCDTSNVLFKVRMNPSYEGDDYSFVLDEVKDKFLIVEGDWSGRLDLLTEEYFGKYRVNMSSHGKNLFDGKWILNEGIDGTTGKAWNSSSRNRTDFIEIKPNTRYVLSNCYLIIARFYDKNKKVIEASTINAVSPSNAKYLRFSIDNTFDFLKTQLEEGTQATEYEPYYGSTKTVYLNSPLLNGDELLTKDGKLYHYHKMGKVVLDGSEDWLYNTSNDTIIRFCYKPSMTCKQYAYDISDKFPSNGDRVDIETIFQYENEGIIIGISKSKLSTTDVTGFKQWLSENPTTVVYELASPYYEEISSIEDMRFNIASTSTIEYQSNVPMANTQFLPYRNELPLLESSTQYRVTFDCDVEGLELMVSLGGTSQTITSGLHNELSFITPSLQTDGKLTIDGYGIAKIDNVLITKGNMEYKYFEGLKSGFEYRYIPVDITKDFENLIVNAGTGSLVDVSISNIKPNTKYTLYAPALEGNYIALRFRTSNNEELSTAVNSEIPFTNPIIIETYDDTYDFSNVILRYYCDFIRGTSFSTKDIKVFEGDWSYLTEYLNELSEEDWNNSETYKATIRIQNPNAPIFGKGGRL